MKQTTILLADDHEIVLDGIEAMLSGEKSLHILGRENDGLGVLERLHKKPQPDLIILDINMPNKDGIEVSYQVKAQYPHIKILILSMHNRNEFVRKLIDAGADGYVMKNSGRKELLKAIKSIVEGQKYFDVQILKKSFERQFTTANAGIAELTEREKEVVKLIAQGWSTKEIAAELVISQHTVDSHRKNILLKTNTNNPADITRFALKTGIIKGFDIL